MPADASATIAPSRTSAKANTSTHDTAKKSVVDTISRLLSSIATSFLSTSSATLRNISAPPQKLAISQSKSGIRNFVTHEASGAQQQHAVDESVCEVEIVRR